LQKPSPRLMAMRVEKKYCMMLGRRTLCLVLRWDRILAMRLDLAF
jgi:hypothetical protein